MICILIRITKNQQLLDANTNYEEEIARLQKENVELINLKTKLSKETKYLEE